MCRKGNTDTHINADRGKKTGIKKYVEEANNHIMHKCMHSCTQKYIHIQARVAKLNYSKTAGAEIWQAAALRRRQANSPTAALYKDYKQKDIFQLPPHQPL